MRSLSHGRAVLSKASAALRARWAATGSSWRDRARREFEDEYLSEFLLAAASAAAAMEHARTLLHKAIGECT